MIVSALLLPYNAVAESDVDMTMDGELEDLETILAISSKLRQESSNDSLNRLKELAKNNDTPELRQLIENLEALNKNTDNMMNKFLPSASREIDINNDATMAKFYGAMPTEMKEFYDSLIPLEFIENIKSCKVSEFKSSNFKDGEHMKKTILGIEDGKCKYEEVVMEGMFLRCHYPVEKLSDISKDYEKYREKIMKYMNIMPDTSSLVFKLQNDPSICRSFVIDEDGETDITEINIGEMISEEDRVKILEGMGDVVKGFDGVVEDFNNLDLEQYR